MATCQVVSRVKGRTWNRPFVGGWSATLGIRLGLAVLVWVLLAELLAELASRQQRMTEVLRRAAHTDVLTGLGNRRDLDLRLPAVARPA